jgi:chromosome segregation ATPase
MSRNQIINSNSVQSQFALLVRDKESLHKQSTNADNERRHEESQLQNLRYLQSTLSEKIRVAHANLGVQSKKKQMLNTEMKRLKKVLEDDRNAIEELVVRVEQLEEQNIERKFQFVKEMDGLNEELADALRMYEEKGLEKMLKSVGSCHAIEHFLSEKIQQDNLPQDQHWNSIYHSISDVVGRLEQNIQNLDNNKRNYVSLCEKAQQLRQKVETKHSKVISNISNQSNF